MSTREITFYLAARTQSLKYNTIERFQHSFFSSQGRIHWKLMLRFSQSEQHLTIFYLIFRYVRKSIRNKRTNFRKHHTYCGYTLPRCYQKGKRFTDIVAFLSISPFGVGFPASKLKLRRRSNARRDCEHIFLVGSIKARRRYAFSSTDEAALRGSIQSRCIKHRWKWHGKMEAGCGKDGRKKREKRQREAGISRLYHLQQAVTLLVNYNRLPEERGIIL